MTTALTAIVTELNNGRLPPPVYDRPLIYSIAVDDPNDEDEVLRAVAAQRADELGLAIETAANGLQLHFAFFGDISAVCDWRY